MQCNIRSENSIDILELSGEVDLNHSPALRKNILNSLKNDKPLLIDMSGVTYIDSSGIASLVEGFQTAKSASLAYGLLSPSVTTLQVLKLTRLDKIFALHDTVEHFQAQV